MTKQPFLPIRKQHSIKDVLLVVALMTSIITFYSACLFADTPKSANKEPVRIIFDTDIGGDIDDALALALIHGLQNKGECKLLAVTCTGGNRYDAPYVDVVNTFYGRNDIPIGMCWIEKYSEAATYTRLVATATDEGRPCYCHKLLDGSNAPDAVAVLRKVLSSQPDASVVVVQVGSSANMARLLDSKPDAISLLDGLTLVRQKVRLFCPMAGYFGPKVDYGECNIGLNIKAAQQVFEKWPTPIITSGWEVGDAVQYPWRSIIEDYNYLPHHPIAEAYKAWANQCSLRDRGTWDLTSVLYAVRPDAGFFGLSPMGRITVEPNGITRFHAEAGGAHRYLTIAADHVANVRNVFTSLCSGKPLQADANGEEMPSAK